MTTDNSAIEMSRRLLKARDMYAVAQSGEVEGEAYELQLKRFDDIIDGFPEEEPAPLHELAYAIQQLRLRQLCEHSTLTEGPFAEQHYCMALDLLSQARHQVLLAQYHTARELGDVARERALRG